MFRPVLCLCGQHRRPTITARVLALRNAAICSPYLIAGVLVASERLAARVWALSYMCKCEILVRPSTACPALAYGSGTAAWDYRRETSAEARGQGRQGAGSPYLLRVLLPITVSYLSVLGVHWLIFHLLDWKRRSLPTVFLLIIW